MLLFDKSALCAIAFTLFLIFSGCTAPGPGKPLPDGVASENGQLTIDNPETKVRLEVDTGTGVYRISHRGGAWMGDGIVAVRPAGKMLFNIDAGGRPSGDIRLTDYMAETGEDASGAYRSISLAWAAQGLAFQTEFRVYDDAPQIKFMHIFPEGYTAQETGAFEQTALNFPIFLAGGEGNANKHLFSYNYIIWPSPQFGRGVAQTLEKWGPGAIRIPFMIMDEGGAAGILSPLNDYIVRINRVADFSDAGLGFALAAGLNGEIKELKEGHVSETLLRFDDGGPTAAIKSWGDELLKVNGKEPVEKDSTFFLKHLGYWTDNGAYYYYRTEPGANYETTLLELGEYLEEEKIPVRLLQLDSWWYFKAKGGGGALRWEPMPELFPRGLVDFQQELGLPLTFHNRWIDNGSPYKEEYGLLEGSRALLPGRALFDHWAEDVVRWGGIMYEQDWLGTQVNRIEQLRSDAYLGEQWLTDMSEAMDAKDLEIQYCMPTMAFYLASTKFRNVTNIRTSNDYKIRVHGSSGQLWYEQVYASPIAWAAGLLPFKDVMITNPPGEKAANPVLENFTTTTGTSRGAEDLFEPFYHQSALLSILSAGPVGIGDRIGEVNRDIVMLMADENGDLVKPDHPLIPIDRMYFSDARNEHVALVGHTSTQNAGRTWHYALALNAYVGLGAVSFELTGSDIHTGGDYVIYDFLNNRAKHVEEVFELKMKLPPSGLSYLVLAPVSEYGRAVIGDAGKYVTAAPERISSIDETADFISVELAGPEGSPAKLVIYSRSAPAKVTAGETEIQKVKKLDGTGPAWAQTGKALYTVSLAGGMGTTVRVEF